ncbi:pyocin activator PrtN family protein [Halomonas sp. M5N1S17]|uniref:pyocin activator PrtN family protein n=1 Tax=Halomonas alkalisoli TaxID=2907158 RepID=UPI001F1F3C3B|nr:pyocin activator PrtN family protein [Halomonas alkalisoli]MCE9664496.1 pyocin activator PrtN family protein [Halomonas alkalisoli]
MSKPDVDIRHLGSEEPTDDTSTVALLYRQFGGVLIDPDAVRKAYFRNLNEATFKRALRDGRIPLPLVTLDDSAKAMTYVCIYQLAALIESRATHAAAQRQVLYTTSEDKRRLRQRMIDAVPETEFRTVALATAD